MNSYLVDTSVWIDFFRQRKTLAVDKLYQLIEFNQNYGITALIYQEIIQGASSETDFYNLSNYLTSQIFFSPKYPLETHQQAGHIYFNCRRKGITIRSTIDCLIAQIAIEHDLILLHNDKDFEQIAKVFPDLKLWK